MFVTLLIFLFVLPFNDGFITSSRLRPIPSTFVKRLSGSSVYDASTIPTEVRKVPYTGEGCVLLAQPGDHDHFLIKSAILIFVQDPKRGTQGVILDKPSAYKMAEMAQGLDVFYANTLFTGGSEGQNTVIMAHQYPIESYCRSLGKGLYVGGIRTAKELIDRNEAHPKDFKFFFNNIQWGPGELERELEAKRWDVCELPPSMVLEQDAQSPHFIWHKARSELRKAGSLIAM